MADEDAPKTGPAIRYRYSFGGDRSFEVGLGTPVVSEYGEVRPGSLLGMAKYNPNDWLGLTVRPEYVRSEEFRCFAGDCTEVLRWSGHVYGGIELGGRPGRVASYVVLGLLALAVVLAEAGV
jgi:hypothetical protein